MKVINLNIERKPQYDNDYPNMIVGLVQMQGEHGKMEVKLSNSVVAEIFKLVKEDVQRVADYNSSQAGHAVEEAANEAPLLEQLNPSTKDGAPF